MPVDATPNYTNNLRVLQDVQPALADVIHRVPLPAQARVTTGRDGSQTIQLPDETGRMVWLGGSSMPTVSAAELMGGFAYAGGNLSLLGIHTGVEPLLILAKLPPHAALFVIESDPRAIKLAMHLHRYVEPIRTGQLVLLLESGLEASLEAFFEKRCGYVFPSRMLTVPHAPTATVTEIQRRLEAATDNVVRGQMARMDSCIQRLAKRVTGPIGTQSPIAIVGTDPSRICLTYARQLEKAANRLGMPVSCCVPTRPDRCHLEALLHLVESQQADLVLVVGGGGRNLRSLLPPSIPVVSWLPPQAPTDTQPADESKGMHRFVVATRLQHKALSAIGISEQAIRVIGPSLDPDALAPSPAPTNQSERSGIAMIADVPDDRPAAVGVTFASHVRLVDMLRQMVADGLEDYRDENADAILAAAQRRTGVSLSDADLRDQYITLIRQVVAPAAVTRATRKALAATGAPVRLWGNGWATRNDEPNVADPEPVPCGTDLTEACRSVQTVVFPALPMAHVQTWLEALASGARVICHANARPTLQSLPTLAALTGGIPSYRTIKSLLACVDAPVEETPTTAVTTCRRHAADTQLKSVIDWLAAPADYAQEA